MPFHLRHDPDWHHATAAERAALTVAADSATTPPVAGGELPQVCRFRVTAPGVAPTRLVFITDLHWRFTDWHAGEALLNLINAAEADWLLFGGDLACYLEHLPSAKEWLSRLRAKRGKLAVPGNWEHKKYWLPVAYWRQAYDDVGFRLLVNEILVPPEPEAPVFVGYDDYRFGRRDSELADDLPQTHPGRYVVGLMHSPATAGHTTGHFLGHLLLAGHTHGGQWRLPGFGAVYTSTPYGKQFEYGWLRRSTDQAQLLISAGLGVTGPGFLRRRVCCPPEIVVLDLVPPEPP